VIRLVLSALGLTLPAMAGAQAYRCPVPAGALDVRPDGPDAGQPRRLRTIGSYTLAISWSPNHCRTAGDQPASRFQCRDGRFGWTLHGLWPDGTGAEWPQYCRPARLLPQPVIRNGLCATPSAQLMQHEWAKHGTCMAG
jgi:ribonuclease T2